MSLDDFQIFGLVLHDIITAYQIGVRETLGNSDTVLINLVECLCDNVKLKDVDIDRLGFEEMVAILASQLGKLGIADISLTETGPQAYLFNVREGIWAEYVHGRKQETDVTCPLALIALSLYQASTGNKVFVPDSHYSEKGSTTKIRPVTDIVNLVKL